MYRRAASILVATSFATLCIAQTGVPDAIVSSHIGANVPGALDFDRLLLRDLVDYLQSRGEIFSGLKYQMLRNGPTQTGISYPKYYVWVTLLQGEKSTQDGAVRIAAIDATRFEITHYLKRADIVASPEAVAQVFPAPLVAGIIARAKSNPP